MHMMCTDKDIIMEKGKKYGFKVYLGMGVNNDWWGWDLIRDEDFEKFKGAMIQAGKIAREIYNIYHTKYPETFGGFYSVYEVWNHNRFNEGNTIRDLYAERLATGFNIVIDSLNKIDSTMPLLFSQFATDDPSSMDIDIDGKANGFGTLRNTELFWTKFLELAHFRRQDKMLPMDAVGGGGQTINTVEPWTEAYGNAVINSQSKIGYYANIESFTQPPFPFLYDTDYTPLYGRNYNSSAPIGRYARQIATAQRHVKGIFSFAFSHYHSPVNNIPGFYDVLTNYLEDQSTDTIPPKLPNRLTIVDTVALNTALSNDSTIISDRIFMFLWEGASDDHGVWRVNLYKNDSVYAYSVSTRTESGVTAHEPDTIYFAYNTKRSAEYIYNPRYTEEEDYHLSVVDVWGNETFSQSFILKPSYPRITIPLEDSTSVLYKIPLADSLRSHNALDSSDIKQLLVNNSQILKNECRITKNGNSWTLHYNAKLRGEYAVRIFSATGARVFDKKINMVIGENAISLPENSIGYSRFYVQVLPLSRTITQ